MKIKMDEIIGFSCNKNPNFFDIILFNL